MRVSESFKAWVAGFLDGDGSIGIHKQRPSLKQGLVHTAYYVAIQFTNTDEKPLNGIQAIYGGHIRSTVSQWGRYFVYHLTVAGNQAVRLLKDVYPYLITKREQARLCLELAESIARFKHYRRSNFAYIPACERQHRESLYRQVLQLNQRGGRRCVRSAMMMEETEPSGVSNSQLPLFGIKEILVEQGEASPELAEKIARRLDGRTQDVRDAIRVARLAPTLGVERAIELLLPPG